MRDWARRRAHLKVPLGRRLCDCSECHDRSESCTCFCILYWASPCQQLYSSYLLHCTSTSLDQQTGFPLSSCLLSCSQSRKSFYRAWIDRSRLSPAGSPLRTVNVSTRALTIMVFTSELFLCALTVRLKMSARDLGTRTTPSWSFRTWTIKTSPGDALF